MPEVTRAKEKQQMQTRMETRRLILRPFEPADLEAAFGWFGDPVVMWFTVTSPDKSIEETKKRLTYFDNHQQAHGFSKWVILNAASGVAIGDSGLLVLPECGWIDLGFRLAQPYWGHGFATEAALAWVHAAFDEFHIHRLGAFVHPENVASIRVLEKLGFQTARRDTVMGMDSIVFYLDANSCKTPAA